MRSQLWEGWWSRPHGPELSLLNKLILSSACSITPPPTVSCHLAVSSPASCICSPILPGGGQGLAKDRGVEFLLQSRRDWPRAVCQQPAHPAGLRATDSWVTGTRGHVTQVCAPHSTACTYVAQCACARTQIRTHMHVLCPVFPEVKTTITEGKCVASIAMTHEIPYSEVRGTDVPSSAPGTSTPGPGNPPSPVVLSQTLFRGLF